MDVVRKFGLYMVAGVLLLAAIVFYFLVVNKASSRRSTELAKIESHAKELASYARNVPNPKQVEVTREAYEKERQNLDACEQLFAGQPRDRQRRLFFLTEDPTHPEYCKTCTGEVQWLERYETAIEELHLRLEDAGMSDWIVADNPWGTSVPERSQIQAAQEAYWFQKDLVEMLTDGIEAEFEKLIKMLKGGAEGFPKGPADLVIDFNATLRGRDVTNLDESLRNLPSDKLRNVLEAIIINRKELDLPSIFDEYLSEHDYSWDKVRELTMDEKQRQFLSKVRSPNEPDLSYHQRFVDYVTELRTVRYRKDVLGLLSRHGFKEIEKLANAPGQETRERIRKELSEWNPTKLAQAIASVVSIRDQADYELVRDNHKLKLAAVEGLTFTRPVEQEAAATDGRAGSPGRPSPESGGRSRGSRGAPGEMGDGRGRPKAENELGRIWTFTMRVKVEFERIPVFQRRFMSNCWHYGLEIDRVAPGGGSSETTRAAPSSRGWTPGAEEHGSGGRRRTPEPRRPAAAPGQDDEETTTEVESDRYIWLECRCVAHQYIPKKAGDQNTRSSRPDESETRRRSR